MSAAIMCVNQIAPAIDMDYVMVKGRSVICSCLWK